MRFFTLQFVVALLAIFTSCDELSKGPSSINAVSYNDSIIEEQSKVIKYMLDMTRNMESNLSEADKQREAGVNQAKLSIRKIEMLGDFKGDNSLGNAAMDMFKFYQNTFESDFKEMLSILKKEKIDSLDIQRVSEINASLAVKETQVHSAFEIEQKKFAQKNGFEMKENEMQKDLDNAIN